MRVPSSSTVRPQVLPGTIALLLLVGVAVAAPVKEQLIVFTSAPDTAVARAFATDYLPKVGDLAGRLGVELLVRDVKDGAPREIAITPLWVFQNARGRSIYQGRFSKLDKLENFIQTSRYVPGGTLPVLREEVVAATAGRAHVVAALKITPLSGDLPTGHDPIAFAAAARRAVIAGLDRLRATPRIELRRTDRQFYFDLHPYRGADGQLSVSLAIFSQFNCIEPVYTQFEAPVAGQFAELDAVFARAGSLLEAEMWRLVASPERGDGFDPIATDVPTATWESLDLQLPVRDDGATATPTTAIDLPLHWSLATDGSRLMFRFQEPLDSYSGRVTGLTAELLLGKGATTATAHGWVLAETATVTMGDDALDAELRRKTLNVGEHPAARFTLESMSAAELQLGQTTQVTGRGSFELLGRRVPVDLVAQLEPSLDADGAPRLEAHAKASIRLADPFGIQGPPGPLPASDTVVLYVDLVMTDAADE